MYRNVVYNINNKWEGEIKLFHWDKNGNEIVDTLSHSSHLYYEDSSGQYKSIYGTNLKKKFFKNVIERKRWIDRNPKLKIYESLPPEREFLINRYNKINNDKLFNVFPLNVFTLDIEVEVQDEFPEAEKAKYPINIITIHDSKTNKYHIWTYSKIKDITFKNTKNKKYYGIETDNGISPFTQEISMLKSFLVWFSNNYPDIITGWNIIGFDIPYIVNRIKKLFGDEGVEILSPIGKVMPKYMGVGKYGQRKATYLLKGISLLDYLQLYRDKFGPTSLQSYKLNYVGLYELKIGKIDIDDDYKTIYKRDFKLYVDYNIQDVKIVVDLEKKLKFIELSRTICNMGLCEYEGIYNTSPAIYGALTLQAIKNNTIILSDKQVENEDKTFSGAHVFNPKTGVYRTGVSSLDLNSLYPNIMITLNISPETKIGKIVEEDNDIIFFKKENGKIVKYNKKDFDLFIEKRCTISSNKVVYIKPNIKQGIIPQFLVWLYDNRKQNKSKMKKLKTLLSSCNEKLKVIIDEDNKNKLKKIKRILNQEIDKLSCKDGALKVLLNGTYGQLGNAYFPLCDYDNAEAVTLSGRHIIQKSSEFIDNYIKKQYNYDGIVSIYGDTDSVDGNTKIKIKELV